MLVAIHEGVVGDDGSGISGREIEDIGIPIGVELSGAGKGGFKEVFVTQPRCATMFVELAGMYGENLREIEPYDLGHLARARKVLR